MATISIDLNDLKFFGAVSASISHEMKNVLAIINKMMGLLAKCHLETDAGSKTAGLTTNAFALQHLIWACLEQAVKLTEQGATVQIAVNQDANGPRICFGPASSAQKSAEAFTETRHTCSLANRMGAELTGNPSNEELILTFTAGPSNPSKTP